MRLRPRVKLAYIAGPYRAPTAWGIHQHIQRALAKGAEVVQRGWLPVVPHACTAHMDGLAPDEWFLEGTLELMRRCDVVVLVEGWAASKGTLAEIAEAQALGIPVLMPNFRPWPSAQLKPEGVVEVKTC